MSSNNQALNNKYCNLLDHKLNEIKLPFKREFIIIDTGNIIDFLIDNKIIVEVKAKQLILKADYYQVQRYLQASNKKLALLVNFRNRYLKPIRVIRIDTDAKEKFI